MKFGKITLIHCIIMVQIGHTQIDLHVSTPAKRLIPYEFVREADVIWSKRVWEQIDLREKINHSLYYPLVENNLNENNSYFTTKWCLWAILKKHVLNGELTLYSPYNPQQYELLDGDGLKYPIEPTSGKNYYTDKIFQENLFSYFGKLDNLSEIPCVNIYGEDSTEIINGTTTFIYPPRDTIWIKAEDIIQYHIKEDWFYDKERSVMDVRIIAIAPVVYTKDETDQIIGTKELFWLYFPHCRIYMNTYLVFNEKNDAQSLNYDDLFWKRRFSSTIYKESNVFDRNLEMYRTSVDALYEANKIKDQITKIEHDLWSF